MPGRRRPGGRRLGGSLIRGQQDISGLMYRRNRDPQTGQFTQSDPIGIAGGLNTYGFANGDPVSYGDPYGLSADDCTKNPTLLCRIGHAITRIIAGPPPDPNSNSGALSSPGMLDPVAIGSGMLASRLAPARGLAGAGASQAAGAVANPVPPILARVVPANVEATTLGAPGAVDVFVTDAAAIAGMNAKQIAQTLAIRKAQQGSRSLSSLPL